MQISVSCHALYCNAQRTRAICVSCASNATTVHKRKLKLAVKVDHSHKYQPPNFWLVFVSVFVCRSEQSEAEAGSVGSSVVDK